MGSAIKDTGQCGNSLKDLHPINIGANIYGVASCLAFLRMIWIFELHHRIGPILFCIKVIIVYQGKNVSLTFFAYHDV